MSDMCFESVESATFESANLIGVCAYTNGFQGGDAGHGCVTYIRFEDFGSTCIRYINLIRSYGEITGFEIELGGDCELETTIQAFEWVARSLRRQAEEANNGYS